MAARQPIAAVFGGVRIGNKPAFLPDDGLQTLLSVLTSHHVTAIDTAQSYGNSEASLGRVQAGKSFTIDTKWSPPSWNTALPWASRDHIVKSAEESINRLCLDQLDVFYLHSPDPLTPMSETLAAVNEVFRRGQLRRFGLSGFSASQVEEAYNHCLAHNYPLPTVCQGSYNPLHRIKESALFPTLRRLGISFYAFGTSAGGLLGKSVAQAEKMAADQASVSATCRPYLQDAKYLRLLARWNHIADREGIGGAEMAYRWVAYHSALRPEYGDALVFGASSPQQVDSTLNGIGKGPLSDAACADINELWEGTKGS